MRWPWQKPEKRSASWSDAVSRLLHLEAGTEPVLSRQLAGAQIAAGIIGRAFGTLTATGVPDSVGRALDPRFFSHVGRELVLSGECVYYLDVDDEGLELIPVGSWHIEGRTFRRQDWTYRLYIPTPTGGQTVLYVPEADVLHVQADYRTDMPWLAKGPGEARTLVKSAQKTESSVSAAVSSPVGKIVPAPLDADDTESAQALQERLAKMSGELLLVESQGSAWGSPVRHEMKLQRDWGMINLSPELPDAVRQLMLDQTVLVGMMAGIPPEMLMPASAEGKRESFRQFYFATLQPLIRLTEHELRIKLDAPDLRLEASIGAADLQGRARAFKSLVDGGVPLEQALHLAGMD